MSITKRILDVAKSNLNALLEKAAEQADPRRKLSDLTDEELDAEIVRRRQSKQVNDKVDAARAQVDAGTSAAGGGGGGKSEKPGAGTGAGAGAGAGAAGTAKSREEREREAKDREARVRAAREAREREAAQSRPKQSPPRGAPPPQQRRPDQRLKQYYDRLELPNGAPFEDVKASYRRLMRKYHPDMHAANPEKLKAATEVSQALTQAYNELEKALLGGPNRR